MSDIAGLPDLPYEHEMLKSELQVCASLEFSGENIPRILRALVAAENMDDRSARDPEIRSLVLKVEQIMLHGIKDPDQPTTTT